MKTWKNRYYRKTLWKTVFVAWMAITIPAASFISCGKWEDITEKDTVAPTIDISKSEIDITWWKEIKISGNQLYIGDNLVASWSDNKSTNCNVELSLNWKSITSWTTISEAWTLNIKVSDAAGNTKTADIKLSIESDISWIQRWKRMRKMPR